VFGSPNCLTTSRYLSMRILIIHNEYRRVGGEESVVNSEADLLERKGHSVARLIRSNKEIDGYGFAKKLKLFKDVAWSTESWRAIRDAVRDFKADVVHVHNTYPLFSPSVFSAAHAAGAATVLTLHNFRLICINGLLFRGDRVCTACEGRRPWRGVLHRCYGGSLLGSMAVARLLESNRRRGTWDQDVDAFIALTAVNGRETFIRAGLPADRLHVKANFIQDPWSQTVPLPSHCKGAVYIGHLVPCKGVELLVRAWSALKHPLLIIGAGPLDARLRSLAPPNVRFAGALSLEAVLGHLSEAAFVVFPSLCQEGFARVIVEAFAMGRAVIAPRHGAMAEIVRHNENGLFFDPLSDEDLRTQVRSLFEVPGLADRLGSEARREYLRLYTADVNYGQILEIYERAIARFRTLGRATGSRAPSRDGAIGVPAGRGSEQ
jgi:glycosyltransferase involved in cell wall biosynthesis